MLEFDNHLRPSTDDFGDAFPDDEQGTRSFGAVAPYYDELMKTVPYPMWVGYYLLLLSQQDVRPRRMLDIACGTGTMCELLTDEGFQMAGIDLSEGMIDMARRKAGRKKLNIRYEVADAGAFDMGETYEAALSFFDSLNNILDPDHLKSAFQCAYNHLEPGGSWIFDLNMAYAFEQRMFDQEYLRSNARLRYRWIGDYDPGTRIIQVTMRFWYRNQEFVEVHRQRAYTKDEVIGMLEDVGFKKIRAYNSYTLNPPRPKSDRIHFTAIRPD